jgi:DNA modification methylase
METNSIGLIHTSIPFGNHYEYSASYNDFGHNDTNEVFWHQMDFLIPELHRVLNPGRNAIIHVKDRIRYGTMTGEGMTTLDPFSDECTTAFRKHGFLYMGRITIVTDVVRENNQTYRLGHSEKCKDASKMGCGLPEYLLIFRKGQTDKSKGYADEPVTKSKSEYGLSKWQTDASSFWRSSGNRLLEPKDVADWEPNKIMKWFKEWSKSEVYDYEKHIALADALAEKDKLSKTFSMLQPQSWDDESVWTGINYMLGLNAAQRAKKSENHICPLPFDIVNRVIECWSMEGDTVLDPFGGLMTVPMCAIKKKRSAVGIELNPDYYRWGCAYLRDTEIEMNVPTLFDIDKAIEDLNQSIAV